MPELSYPDDKVCACGKQAVVGYGKTPEWLCQADFEIRLKEVRKTVKALTGAR